MLHKSAVDQAGGAQIVIDHLRSLCSITDPANEKLLTVFCGMLMNYSNENEKHVDIIFGKLECEILLDMQIYLNTICALQITSVIPTYPTQTGPLLNLFKKQPPPPTELALSTDSLQAQLINMGVIPTLVKLLGIHCQNAALTEMCLVAFGNLAELVKEDPESVSNLPHLYQQPYERIAKTTLSTLLISLDKYRFCSIVPVLIMVHYFLVLAESENTKSSKEQFASTNIAEELVKLFKKQIEHDKREMIFEVLAPLAENVVIDTYAIKLQLVEAGLVECLLEIVQQKVDSDKEDDITELKTGSDLMVLLLLGDESMQKLFEGGKGSVFQRVLSWIPSNNHQLQLAGALAIANFARNDGNCIHMVDNGIVEKLMDLLDRHVEDGNVTVQHAALSALRNLAIPVINKAKMLSAGVTETVLKFLKSEMPPVQFKLLGTLRMLIDAQAEAAEQLGKNVKLVERLVEWCEAKDHAGVMGESNRLLSALIRHSKSKTITVLTNLQT
ncbi:Rap1 GTPase-GDP dissociation stimulator 1-A [Saguinus oedipus]|uniref:Rap1 GTPase-GDP dissociation stimulator 1-A n=1 Tax=Saguinus oedipus TaxID=9490 RepID=A0ABQ9W342_SAGOE|nr:Rap1 GTPase-GDP dissociation stimulator 1-A [Saguinus oedipus]